LGFPEGLGRLGRWEDLDLLASDLEHIPRHGMGQASKQLSVYLANTDTFPAWVALLDRKV
jgi:hypothetical protein